MLAAAVLFSLDLRHLFFAVNATATTNVSVVSMLVGKDLPRLQRTFQRDLEAPADSNIAVVGL